MEEQRRAGEAGDDDLAFVAELQPDAVPPPAAVERDRTRLRHAIQASTDRRERGEVHQIMSKNHDEPGNTEVGDREPTVISLSAAEPRQGAARRRPILAAAAAALVVAVGGVLVMAGDAGDSEEPTDAASASNVADEGQGQAPGPGEGNYTCGAEVPVDIPVPEGYSGPTEGPGPDSLTEPADGQLVAHWTSDHGSIEVMWPPPAEAPVEAVVGEPGGGATGVLMVEDSSVVAPSGREAKGLYAVSETFGEGPCTTLAITIAHDDATQLGQTALAVHNDLFGRRPLVASSVSVEEEPEVIPCDVRDGEDLPLYAGGPVDDLGSFSNSEEAMQAFLESQRVVERDPFFEVEMEHSYLPESGYTEMSLPDGSISYAYETEDGVTVLVHTVETGDGWTVDRWRESGC